MARVLRSRTRSHDPVAKEEPTTNISSDSTIPKTRRKRKQESDEEVSDISDDEMQERKNIEGRPFEVIDLLPASVDPPNYNSALTHPLSVKDSAVLYNSLIQSRRTWLKGEMFELYWVRPQRDPNHPNVNGANSGIRDRMQKMCDCSMVAGPHKFDIRLYILKDDDIENKWQEEQDRIKREREERKVEAIEEKKKRIEDRKQQALLKKQEREQKSIQLKEERLKARQEQELQKLRLREEKKRKKEEERLQKKLKKERERQERIERDKKEKEERAKLKLKLKQEKANEKAKEKQGKGGKKPAPAPDHVNADMIANLNRMAHTDPALNTLMNRVAKNLASEEELIRFKEIMAIAEKMGPPKSSEAKVNNSKVKVPIVSSKNKVPIEKKEMENSKGEKSEEENTVEKDSNKPESDKTSISNTDTVTSKDTVESKEILGTKDAQDKKETVKDKDSHKDKDNHKDKSIDQLKESESKKTEEETSNSSKNTLDNKKKIDVKSEKSESDVVTIAKKKVSAHVRRESTADTQEEQKLTAFQQKYVNGAHLVLEYVEFTNFRYRLPNECVIEYLKEENKYIISWIIIHNLKDITRYSKKKKLKTVNEALFLEDCPTPLFSCIDMTISDIPVRFEPIMINSAKPLVEMQNLMQRILDIGTRLSGYNLWYQLDAYDDMERAEDLRIDLNDYEHSLRGKRQKKNM
ncbi:SWR1-complex protein 3 [Maudiozyma exigua]|uniref:SWR1-complex protein 3 n=1 Tax=Maudiozyma exigua TaxID=34358 RepID=A0A9P6WEV7_MAUEX|nr:SWR1-complex protein 3 [Kazachstania exigua]